MTDGTFAAHIQAHIKENGESPNNHYSVRLHGDGAVVTVGHANRVGIPGNQPTGEGRQ